MNTYTAGDVVQFNASYVDLDGNPVDPTTVVFRYRVVPTNAPLTFSAPWVTIAFGSPDSSPVLNTVWRVTEGAYACWLDTTSLVGMLEYGFRSTGTGQANRSSSCIVQASSG